MNKWIATIVSTIIFFGIYTLLEYLFSESINWKMAIISTIIYAILEIGCKIYETKKLKR